jgi:NADH dehydrogenase (ubiquinone) Fe-S protein 4
MIRSTVRYSRIVFNSINQTQHGLFSWTARNNTYATENVTNPEEVVDAKTSMDPEAEVSILSGIPENQKERLVRIFVPSRTAMQQGTDKTVQWKIEFSRTVSTGAGWADPLMGWSASSDPLRGKLNTLRGLNFETLQDAINYCNRNGLEYTVIEPPQTTKKGKSYAKQFRYKGPTNKKNQEDE